MSRGGRALIGRGARQGLPNPVKLRMPWMYTGSQTVSAKIHSQEGNSPDHQLRSQSVC